MKKLVLAILLFSLPLTSFAAIAFDNAGGATVNPGTQLSWNTSTTGSNLAIFVNCFEQNNGDITSVHYGGVAVPQIGFKLKTVTWSEVMFGLIGPPTGTNAVGVSSTPNTAIFCSNSSYTGVRQTVFPEASSTNSGTSVSNPTNLTTTVTTIADNAWLVGGIAAEENTTCDGTGMTSRNQPDGGHQECIGDSNGALTPAGSHALSAVMHISDGTGASMLVVSIAPAVAVSTAPTTHLIHGNGRTRNNTSR